MSIEQKFFAFFYRFYRFAVLLEVTGTHFQHKFSK